MNRRIVFLIDTVILLIISLIACSRRDLSASLVTPTDDLVVEDALVARLEEYEVVEIPLPGEQAWEVMEYSGLGWWQDELVLLPQYPDGIDGNGVGQLYAISGKLVRAFAQDPETEIIVDPIVFDDAGLSEELAGF